MKSIINIAPSESVSFSSGQAGKFLIIREASQTLILRGDGLRPLEVERGDTVNVAGFGDLELYNHHDNSVHVEYQVADVVVSTKLTSTAIDGGVMVSEIVDPIVVSRVQEPVSIDGTVEVSFDAPVMVSKIEEPVRIDGTVAVSLDEPVTIDGEVSVNVKSLPPIQPMAITQGSTIELSGEPFVVPENPLRRLLIMQADANNSADILVHGLLKMPAGAVVSLPASNMVMIEGAAGDVIRYAEQY